MTSFCAAMDSTGVSAKNKEDRTFGENGACAYSDSGVGNQLLALFEKLVGSRPGSKLGGACGISRDEFKKRFATTLKEAEASEFKSSAFADLFLLAWQTRDIEDGKGERDLFYWFVVELYKKFPVTTVSLMPLVAEYGSWLDMNHLYEILCNENGENIPCLMRVIVEVFCQQLKKDEQELRDNGDKAKLSLAAKWAPREGSHNKKLASKMSMHLFPNSPNAGSRFMSYRKLITKLNKHLDTVERHMCDSTWKDINPGAVPSKCLKIHKNAFRNLDKKGGQLKDDPDRVKCAENFQQYLAKALRGEVKVHGKRLQPHELVQACMNLLEDDPILEAQWMDLRSHLKDKLKTLDGKDGFSLHDFVPLSDVSSSMAGIPMMVSIAMGILVSELTSDVFKNRVLTFSENPEWHMLDSNMSLRSKVRSLQSAKWGGSTNFQKAMELILEQCVKNKVPAEEVARLKLFVLSDMQFNEAARLGDSNSYNYYGSSTGVKGTWETHHEILVKSFKKHGYDSVPMIVFWNLRGNTVGFPAQANTPNTVMLSGFSPALLKLLINGDDFLSYKNPAPPTPWELMRKALDSPRYQRVRDSIQATAEFGYTAPPLPEITDADYHFVNV